jgi:hypothetical protein
MRTSLVLAGVLVVGSAVGWSAGCAGSQSDAPFGAGTGVGNGTSSGQNGSLSGDSGTSGESAGSCVNCLSDTDCSEGAVCAQFQGDSFCASACPNEDECGAGTTCTIVSTSNGAQASVCEPNNNACAPGYSGGGGADSGAGGGGGGSGGGGGGGGGSSGMCGTYAGPNVSAGCHSCSSGSSSCQANGCYGGWYCDTSGNTCHAPPSNCSGGGGGGGDAGGGGGGGTVDAGPVTGQIGPTGGTMSRLYFTVVGDTRPANGDDTSGYPTAIIDQIYSDVAALNPAAPFSVSTGDYMYNTPGDGTAAPQVALYLAARAKFSGTFFPAMGNHECTGYTDSNCGSGNTNGVTENYTVFLSQLLAPISQTLPYYSININATNGSWTSKFVFIAANAWDSTQQSWLESTLSQATTYTFIVRHEAAEANTAPGVTPSESIIASHPYTMKIVGHTHTYEKSGAQEVIFGNGGAPLTGSGDYGFGLVQQRSDGTIQFDMIDYQTQAPDTSFRFAVTATGAAASP